MVRRHKGIEFSLILVPASSRDSEVNITPHHPGEGNVMFKTVQNSIPLHHFVLDSPVLKKESLNLGKNKKYESE